ncbi:MAG: PilZ domain-containing protein, partial [Rhodospirillales bacterium]|nr:PilZ domain-containing protein [Rhodospirillales bacterium]
EDETGTDWLDTEPLQMLDAEPIEAETDNEPDAPGGPQSLSEFDAANGDAPAGPSEPEPEPEDGAGTDWLESEPSQIPDAPPIEVEAGNEGDAPGGPDPLSEFEPATGDTPAGPSEPDPEPEPEPQDGTGTGWLESGSSPPLAGSRPEAEAWAETAPAEASSPDPAFEDGQESRPEPEPWSVDDLLPGLASRPAAGPSPESEPESEPASEPASEPVSEAVPGWGGAERRRHERVSVIEAAVIVDGDHHFPCVILNRSEGGAAIRMSDPDQDCPESFTLRPLDGPARHCTRRWREGDKIGVEFS